MDDSSQQTQDTSTVQDTSVTQDSAPLMPDPIADGSLGSSANTPFTDDTSQAPLPPTDQPADELPQTPLEDVGASSATSDSTSQDSAASDDIGAVYAEQNNTADSEPAAEDTAPSDDTSQAASDEVSGDLLTIKQQALEELSPLVSQLEQTPEEKFRTIMMLIQASDNQKLVPDAYEAAKAIGDEKVRAQALLDVVNEINYFSHNKK